MELERGREREDNFTFNFTVSEQENFIYFAHSDGFYFI